jgi:ABC-type lipoprotein export system ATPase subunit
VTASLPRAGAELLVDHVSRVYPGGLRALDDVSLRLDPGEFALLTGRSGSGKSTLLNLVGALDRPGSGRIIVDGVSVADLADPARYRREVVGFVFQLHHLIDALSAAENVEIPLLVTATAAADRHQRARAALSAVGMAARADRRPTQLSGGERQRVAVARALVNQPRLLLADEPTASLDEQSAEELLALLDGLRSSQGCTVLLVSHDPAAPPHATRIARLHDGRLVSDRPADPGASSALQPGSHG